MLFSTLDFGIHDLGILDTAKQTSIQQLLSNWEDWIKKLKKLFHWDCKDSIVDGVNVNVLLRLVIPIIFLE